MLPVLSAALVLLLAFAVNAFLYQDTTILSVPSNFATPAWHNFSVGGGIPSYHRLVNVFMAFDFNFGNAHRLGVDLAPFGCAFDTDFVFENDCDMNVFITPNGPGGAGAALVGTYTFNDAGVNFAANVGTSGIVNPAVLYRISANSSGFESTTLMQYYSTINRATAFGQIWSLRFRNFGTRPTTFAVNRSAINLCTAADLHQTLSLSAIDSTCPTIFVFQNDSIALNLDTITHSQPITIDLNGHVGNQVNIVGGSYSARITLIDSTGGTTSSLTVGFTGASVFSIYVTALSNLAFTGGVTITNAEGMVNNGLLNSLTLTNAQIASSAANTPFYFYTRTATVTNSNVVFSGAVTIAGNQPV